MIAICGMGMGSLAGLLKSAGYSVTGSDDGIYPPMSTQLESLGIEIKLGYKPENLSPAPDLVIVGNAVSRRNPEVEAMLVRGLPYMSLPQVLKKFFLSGKHSVVIAGTHGKTTTTGLIAWLLEVGNKDPGFMAGGVLNNYGTNYKVGQGDFFVVEGDEYDSAFFDKGPKFLHYQPRTAIITGIEFDHADIYRNLNEIQKAFSHFILSLPEQGRLIVCKDDNNLMSLLSQGLAAKVLCQIDTYGLSKNAYWHASDIHFEASGTHFTLLRDGRPIRKFWSPLWGRHNIQNIVGAIAVVHELGVSWDKIEEGLKTFKGVKRRQELLAVIKEITVIDDFAHHPTAVRETVQAIKECFPQRRLWAIFEPRTNTSRRNIFQDSFPKSFTKADKIIIADVYCPEKIKPEERLSPEKLAQDLRTLGKDARHISGTSNILTYLCSHLIPGDVVLIMSNGNFDQLPARLITTLS
jgi:UDP-N-acetylmuramate: L-alanyl-gamma-D-glutamyl-meso-diaminopimelate ligase